MPFSNTWLKALFIIILLFTGASAGFAQDTVSTEDVEFTPITDSVATEQVQVTVAKTDTVAASPTIIKSAEA